MPKVDAHTPGSFCWVDLATGEASAARRFYAHLFGWEAKDSPMHAGKPGVYTTFYKDGAKVAGLYEQSPELAATGHPAHWDCYIAVEDVDAAAAKVEQLGGKIDAQPFAVPGGRMAVVADPNGARFNLYKAAGDAVLQLVNEPGAYGWSELYTSDPGAAVEFYGGLFGWRVKQTTSAEGYPYYQFSVPNGPAVAGMMEIQPEWGVVQPNWIVYFQVADLEASIEKVRELGGTRAMPPMEFEGVGRFAMVSDHADASFMLIQMTASKSN